jgi:hypothetical protein
MPDFRIKNIRSKNLSELAGRNISKKDVEYLVRGTNNIVKSNRELRDTLVRVTDSPHSHYSKETDTITLSTRNPSEFLKELGYAIKSKSNSMVAGKNNPIQDYSRAAAAGLSIGAIPIAVLIAGNKSISIDTKIDLLDTLIGGSSVAVAPGVISSLDTTQFAIRNSPDKLRAIKELGPGALGTIAKGIAGPLAFLGARRVIRGIQKSEGKDHDMFGISALVKSLMKNE